MGFFLAFHSWHLREKVNASKTNTLFFTSTHFQGIFPARKKRQIQELTTFFLWKQDPDRQSCFSFLFKLLWCSFYSNLAMIIALEKPLLAQCWVYSCYRGCNYSLQSVWEFGFKFIKDFSTSPWQQDVPVWGTNLVLDWNEAHFLNCSI